MVEKEPLKDFETLGANKQKHFKIIIRRKKPSVAMPKVSESLG